MTTARPRRSGRRARLPTPPRSPPQRPMRVGLDHAPAAAHAPGVGRYARELARALLALEDAPELRLLDWGGAPRRFHDEALGLAGGRRPGRRLRVRAPRRLLRALGAFGLGADRLLGGVELFHDVRLPPLPVARARRTLALAELPAEHGPGDAAWRRGLLRFDRVLVFSASFAERLAARTGLDPARIVRVPVGADHWLRDAPAAAPPAEPPTILALGAVRRARRPLALLAALERLRAGGLEAGLLFVGRAGDAAAELERALAASPARAAARRVDPPAEPALAALVARAGVLCHLTTEDEGTAVTPLEALHLGVPVVASDVPAFREALGPESHLLPPAAEPAAIAEALALALAERTVSDAIAARRARAAGATWQANAAATVSAWRALFAESA